MIRRSLILDTTVRLVFDGAIVLSIYFLFVGHNQPGGGFVGGLVASAAIALRYIAGGTDEVLSTLRVRPWTLLSAGLALASVTALVPLAFGHAPLDQTAVEWHFELLGKVKVTTATVFDTGVYLIVVGLVLMVFEALGDDPDDTDTTDDTDDNDTNTNDDNDTTDDTDADTTGESDTGTGGSDADTGTDKPIASQENRS